MPKPRPRSVVSLFFDGGSHMAYMVVERAGHMKRRELKFADARAALDWCMSHHARFIFLPAADNSWN